MAEGEAFKLLLKKEGCKRDEDLKVSPHQSEWTFTQSESRRPISPFPFLVTFINLACIAYENHGKDETYLCRLLSKLGLRATPPNETEAPAELEGVPEGFELLAIAEGTASANGYYGVTYINRETSQIILSHRGTDITNWGALKTDVKSIWLGKFTPQVLSAITFAHIVAQFAQENNCQLFFTGHSLGAWLAQITCFSVKYLTLNVTGYFVSKPPGEWDDLHPYTVAFDSPGAVQFLLKMKDHFFARNEPQSQIINVACLPVQVFQFYPNSVTAVNTQVGSVYIMDLDKARVKYSYFRWYGMRKSITKKTHKKNPVRKFITKYAGKSETEVLRCEVIDWRVKKLDDFLHKWGQEGRSIPVELHKFPEYFLTRKELYILKKLRKKKNGGCYEGLFCEDEEVANRLVEFCKRGVFVEGSVQLGENVDRREVIPQVRQFAMALKNKVIWWNPTKPPVLENYIERSVAESHHLRFDGSLPSYVPQSRLEELVEPLVLVVDPPGMGKSSEMSDLEIKLRKKFSGNRLVLRVDLNGVQRALSKLSPRESASRVLLKLAPFLPANIFETEGVDVFVLLDGLDEVCPAHQATMINLLRILSSSEEQSMIHLRLFLTTRPHLRGVVEEEFKLKSLSLLPLTVEEQDEYMKSVLGKSSEEISGIRGKLTESVSGLLGIPLMLSMFVDVMKSGGDFAGEALNTFDLYTRFVEAKHKFYLLEKRGAKEEDNFTQMELTNIPKRSLPHYYRAAINQLVDNATNEMRLFEECGGIVAQEEPSEERLELISLGLLIGWSDGRLVFRHLSFAEFFYARLLTAEESLPQGVKDVLFGNIYSGRFVLENVEAFVAASLLSKTPPPTLHPSSLLLSLSPNWILTPEASNGGGRMIRKFVDSSHLFPLLVREVLLSCFTGDAGDLWEVHEGLFDEVNIDALRKLYLWMIETENNKEWTRGELLKIDRVGTTPTTTSNPLGVARLMVAIALHFEGQKILSEEEVGVAINRCDRRLVSIVAKVRTGRGGRSKWEWVEDYLSGGRSQLRELFLQMDAVDLSLMIGDMESAWKLVQILTKEEISALLTNEETRVSDICGRSPLDLVVVLGEEFVPPRQLAEFRGKFGKYKGKTVFEMRGGCGFAVKYLLGDVVGEGWRRDESGPVTVALREALWCMWEDDACKMLLMLEGEVLRRCSSCRGGQQEGNEEEAVVVGGVLVDWVAKGLQWREQLNISSLKQLPFVLRYWGSVDPTQLNEILKWKNSRLKTGSEVEAVLRSLVVASSPRPHDEEEDPQEDSGVAAEAHEEHDMDDEEDDLKRVVIKDGPPEYVEEDSDEYDLAVFSVLCDFLRENLSSIDPELQSAVGVFVNATREQIAQAASSYKLVSEVSVGGVLLNLLPRHQQQPKIKATWVLIAQDLIRKTPCCDLPAVLKQLRQQKKKLLKKVVTSEDVLSGWSGPFNLCRVTRLLSFYFSVFGPNLQWMKTIDGVEVGAEDWLLLRNLPVEIATALTREPTWNHLLSQFQEMFREHLQRSEIVRVHLVAGTFSYETDDEWETLLTLINGHTLLPGQPFDTKPIPSAVAAPLLRTLICLYGEEWTKEKLTPDIWDFIPSRAKDPGDSVASLGSLLHSAITLGELEQVKNRAWPAVVKWRNAEGKTALELAMETHDEDHKIRILIESLSTTLPPMSPQDMSNSPATDPEVAKINAIQKELMQLDQRFQQMQQQLLQQQQQQQQRMQQQQIPQQHQEQHHHLQQQPLLVQKTTTTTTINQGQGQQQQQVHHQLLQQPPQQNNPMLNAQLNSSQQQLQQQQQWINQQLQLQQQQLSSLQLYP